MLVLTRTVEQEIVGTISADDLAKLAAAGVGCRIGVTVNRIRGGRVSLGLDAPPEVRFRRDELSHQDSSHDDDRRAV